MLPYIGPEFVEILLSLATDRPVTGIPYASSQEPAVYTSRDRPAPLRRVTRPVLLRTFVVIMKKLIM
jgi:hypothetical protein